LEVVDSVRRQRAATAQLVPERHRTTSPGPSATNQIEAQSYFAVSVHTHSKRRLALLSRNFEVEFCLRHQQGRVATSHFGGSREPSAHSDRYSQCRLAWRNCLVPALFA